MREGWEVRWVDEDLVGFESGRGDLIVVIAGAVLFCLSH